MKLIYFFQMFSMVIYACSGVIAMRPCKSDLINVIFLGTITAVGGGTIRDMILNQSVFWVTDTNYIVFPIFAAIITFYLYPLVSKRERLLDYLDGMALALFVASITKQLHFEEYPYIIVIIMSTITGCVGGILRDVLLNKVPMIFGRTLYITPAAVGSGFYLVAYPYVGVSVATFLCFFTVVIIRYISISKKVFLPSFLEASYLADKRGE